MIFCNLAAEEFTIEVIVPDPDQCQDDRQVLLQFGAGEVLVHRVRAVQQLLEVVEADAEADGETDSRPKGVSAANPVPKCKHVGLGDTKGGNGFGVGREGDEVLGNVGGLLSAHHLANHTQ